MATYNWKSAVSGSWNAAAEWNPAGGPQSVPTVDGPYSADTALFATGSKDAYNVTGDGVAQTLDVSGDNVSFTNFTFSELVSGANLVVEKNARVTIAANSDVNLLTHDGFGSGTLAVNDATLMVEGGLLSLFASVSAHGHLIISGKQSNVQVVEFISGLTVDATSTLSVLNGAGFMAIGDSVAGKVVVSGAGSHLVLSGIYSGDSAVSKSGTLNLDQLDGEVSLASGTVSVQVVAAGATINGSGTISSAFANSGMVSADGGVLTLKGAATGSGSLVIASKATLALDARTPETITFHGLDAHLQLAPKIAATGFLGGFQPGDSIDIAGADITRVGLSRSGPDTVLTAFSKANLIDSFTIGGHIPAGAIGLTADTRGGTLLTYEAPSQVHALGASIREPTLPMTTKEIAIGSHGFVW